MGRNKVHILPVQKRPLPQANGRAVRLPADILFLLALGVAFVLAHYSDKPPLVEKPISIERSADVRIAESNEIGVRVIDSGLRGFER